VVVVVMAVGVVVVTIDCFLKFDFLILYAQHFLNKKHRFS
jgi:hypothetical protein